MGFSCGIVGLPNVGKSTIYQALTSTKVAIEPYAFSTITTNIGVVDVPDVRLEHISQVINPDKIVNTTLNFVDVAGLVEGASLGEGMGNQFLSHIRKVDSIAHVVRCFEDDNVPHVSTDLNPKRDIEVIELELLLKDVETLDKRIEKTKKTAERGDKKDSEEVEFLTGFRDELNEGIPARSIPVEDNEQELIDQLFLLSSKPYFFVANIGEGAIGDDNYSLLKQVSEAAKERQVPIIALCSKLEAELAEIPQEERTDYSAEMGITESGLDNIVTIGYELLNLITYFTTRSNEVKAWTVIEGSEASEAAGKIHSDMEKGFIKADIIKYEDLIEFGSESAVRDLGLVMTVGKNHIVEDGDILHFKFRS